MWNFLAEIGVKVAKERAQWLIDKGFNNNTKSSLEYF